MSQVAQKKAVYQDLYGIPEHMTGEIICGELHVTPRPSRKHALAVSTLGGELIPAYRLGSGGPGGWVLLLEPELGLGTDILVPDLAGWKKERFPLEEPHNWISAVPDWVCEVLSPGTFRKDRIQKMPIYAGYGVPHAWIVDPLEQTVEVFRLDSGKWVVAGLYGNDDRMRAEPFEEVEIALSDLWLP